MDLSRRRQQIRQLYEQLEAPLGELLTRKPFIKGTLYELKTKCGKPNCHCFKGEPHKVMVLTWSEGGRKHLRVVRKDEMARVKKFTGNYRRFRKGRAEVGMIMKKILGLADEIERELLRIGRRKKS